MGDGIPSSSPHPLICLPGLVSILDSEWVPWQSMVKGWGTKETDRNILSVSQYSNWSGWIYSNSGFLIYSNCICFRLLTCAFSFTLKQLFYLLAR